MKQRRMLPFDDWDFVTMHLDQVQPGHDPSSLEAWREAMALETMDLVCHSMGGYYGTHYGEPPNRPTTCDLALICALLVIFPATWMPSLTLFCFSAHGTPPGLACKPCASPSV